MSFFIEIKSALLVYHQKRGNLRRAFGDAPAITALLDLKDDERQDYYKLCLCFFENMPKPGQASHKVWQALFSTFAPNKKAAQLALQPPTKDANDIPNSAVKFFGPSNKNGSTNRPAVRYD